MWNRCNHPGCPDGRHGENLNGNAKTFVESVDVVTEYERGVRDGICRREALAVNIMDFTAKVERHNIELDIENQWLRYQRAGLVVMSVCFFGAFLAAVWH